MEVLDNGSRLKETENPTSTSNFCRLSRDLNIGSSTVARNKGEVDIRLLLACKAQLSSEVVRLKTDSLRLQKERDAARIRMKELDQILLKFTERTRELENRLHISEEENKRLKGRMLGISNVSALQKLSVSLDKFHSYPWSYNQASPLTAANSCLNTIEIRKSPPPQEDWKEISQQLLKKMRQEMKELQEMNSSFSTQENNSVHATENKHENCDNLSCDDELEGSFSSLMLQTESLKRSLLNQRKKLLSLMNDMIQGNVQLNTREIPRSELKVSKTLEPTADLSALSVKPKSSLSQYSRHSDDSFRAFFTKHLEGCQNFDKMNKTMQLFMQSNSSSDSGKAASKVTSPKPLKSQVETEKQIPTKQVTEEERVCPICEESFDALVPQKAFEEHVLDHLEVESASLLDQYVVL